MAKKLNIAFDAFFIASIIIGLVILIIYTPDKLIKLIGVKNVYVLVFFIGLLGGFASMSFVFVYPPIIVIASGGLNFLIIGIIAGIGLTIANSFFFFLGLRGRKITDCSKGMRKFCNITLTWIEKKPTWFAHILIFLYVSITPFPNNLLTTSVGLVDYSYKKLVAPLLLGNVLLLTFLAYLGSIGLKIIG